MVMIIGNVEITGAVHGHSLDGIAHGESRKKLGIEGRTAVAGKARCSIACDGADGSGRVHLAHAVISEIGDVDVAVAVGGQPERVQRKPGAGGWSAVSGKARRAGAGEEGQRILAATE